MSLPKSVFVSLRFLMIVYFDTCICVWKGCFFANRWVWWCFILSLIFYSFSRIQYEQTVTLYTFYVLRYGYCLSFYDVLIFFFIFKISFSLNLTLYSLSHHSTSLSTFSLSNLFSLHHFSSFPSLSLTLLTLSLLSCTLHLPLQFLLIFPSLLILPRIYHSPPMTSFFFYISFLSILSLFSSLCFLSFPLFSLTTFSAIMFFLSRLFTFITY